MSKRVIDRRMRPRGESLETRQMLDGSLDPTFRGNGKLTFDVPGNTIGAVAVAVQPDGKIVAVSQNPGQSQWVAARVNPDGSFDTSFGTNGRATIPLPSGVAYSYAAISSEFIQADGKIVLMGNANQLQFFIAQLNPVGTLDTNFGNAGFVKADFGATTTLRTAAGTLAPDGKFVLVGSVSVATLNSGTDFGVMRLTAAGALDTTFNGTGKQQIPFDLVYAGADTPSAVTVLPDGGIVVAGLAANGQADYDWAVAKLKPSGALDTSFNGTGKKAFSVLPSPSFLGRADEGPTTVTAQSDGTVVLAGNIVKNLYSHMAVARLTPSGALDQGFGGTGTVFLSLPNFTSPFVIATSMVLQKDNKIVLAGYGKVKKDVPYQGQDNDFTAMRLTTSGAPDTSFNGTGFITVPYDLQQGTYPDNEDEANAIAIQPDGNIILAGSAQNNVTNGRGVESLCPRPDHRNLRLRPES